ncbi:hypothetical protein C5167_016325 [Papaver somniferum]|uniref:agmatine coumaroyltransferase-2-like n=1 Tax=Papaver somniferum TaxID=3469 RepID=UPI000E702644|nr:agmatine coumaroyltransferase-2-like [Papaver somniferum]RZC93695.1 hypothetical protein C5167_016325 [Papaver somniferum]
MMNTFDMNDDEYFGVLAEMMNAFDMNNNEASAVQIEQVSSKHLQPIYNSEQPVSTTKSMPLTVFDRLGEDQHVSTLYAYKPPNPSNTLLEQGLRKTLSEFRECAGRFGKDDNGQTIILLNDEGMRFTEASANCTFDQAIPFTPSILLKLSPNLEGAEEIALVQLTRFTCGTLVVSFSGQHIVGDGQSMVFFMVAWSQACRGLDINPRPLCNRNIFVPRNPFNNEFDHRSVEIVKRKSKYSIPLRYKEDYLVQQVLHCTPEFIAKIKSKASSFSDANGVHRPHSTFVCLVAHLWTVITRVRGLSDSQKTYVKISVNGRRKLRPRIPDEYFGNMVLWAFPETQGKNLRGNSLSHAAEIIQKEVMKVDGNYFKSYIDFANENLNDDGLTPRKVVPSCWPNMEIQSWLGFPIKEVDFGSGKPFMYMPSFDPVEGETYIVPSIAGDGSIDVYVTLFQQQQALFKELFYNIYGLSSAL